MTALVADRRWRMTLIIALVTAFSGVMLVGVSAWFLGAVALAGLGPAALTFNFHHPAALVRLFALTRTVGKYAERSVGHQAALTDQLFSRQTLFRQMAAAPETLSAGWQLARADRLQTFLDDVETRDAERLRVHLPRLALGGMALVLLALTAVVLPLSIPVVLSQLALLLLVVHQLTARASSAYEATEDRRRSFGEVMGAQLVGIVSLEAGGERRDRFGETVRTARSAESSRATAVRHLGLAEALAALAGPLSAGSVLVVASYSGQLEEQTLPILLAAFSWLAFGELISRVPGAQVAETAARRAGRQLAPGQTLQKKAATDPAPADLIVHAPLTDPLSRRIGGSVRIEARPGEPLALLGPSGCGKTTLLKRLAGWLPWTAPGSHPFETPENARATSHLSLHDAAILSGTVRDNLFTNTCDTALWKALEAVELRGRIEEGGGLDSFIAQDMLSLGEARRIALARAILSKSPLLLLDEPGEHLGSEQGARILARVLAAARGRTVVFVTHDEALAALATRQEWIDQ